MVNEDGFEVPTPRTAKLLIDDKEEIEITLSPLGGVTALVAPGDMLVTLIGYEVIGPEETVKVANELEQDQWGEIRVNKNFLAPWKVLWEEVQPPEVLARGNLALKHIAGMILLMYKYQSEGVKIHINLPETYLHPRQCRLLMSMIYKIQGNPKPNY